MRRLRQTWNTSKITISVKGLVKYIATNILEEALTYGARAIKTSVKKEPK
jgi:hypothetical protein